MGKVLFLDFDGVLNSAEWQSKQVARDGSFTHRSMDELDPEAIERVNRILEATGAEVVVSSTWRILHSLAELRGFLGAAGFRGRVIGKTPRLQVSPYAPTERRVCRGDEIRQWVDWQNESGRGHVESFVVLDDDGDMDGVRDRFVQTSFATGILDEHVDRAIEMFGHPSRSP